MWIDRFRNRLFIFINVRSMSSLGKVLRVASN